MSYYYSIPLVNEAELAQARALLGTGLARIIGYFREDGVKSISQLEEALNDRNAAAMVIPAHTLKGESRQFGARRLGDIAEVIETTARRCVEQHVEPDEVAGEIAMLRGCFVETLQLLGDAAPPASMPQYQAVAPRAPATTAPRPAAFTAGPRTFGRRTG
ncbi:Hpt domain-containing protein [Sphingobium nicotianae]|uniref:Hpt domain-containing protein n=1 Tax=Sphingobium nicotianae TaxID=2782607 RepID=A0A9X1DCB1_9SPHN|nr:Hpt domain-containing protein [Sphingobium nicotianae]MBT2187053.1 Hpt domain-containing protein [Sphingobium nicotianae]